MKIFEKSLVMNENVPCSSFFKDQLIFLMLVCLCLLISCYLILLHPSKIERTVINTSLLGLQLIFKYLKLISCIYESIIPNAPSVMHGSVC